MSAKVISIALQKGGVGKTTTAQALASTLGSQKKKVCVIDLDGQRNLTYASGVINPNYTITSVLSGNCTATDAIIQCKHYDLLAADEYLVNVERAEQINPTLLKESIQPLLDLYDCIIIDTPPALGNLLFNALAASDYVIIPSEARPFALQGLDALNQTIQAVQQSVNSDLKILGILLIKFNTRTVLNRNIKALAENYAAEIGTTVFKTGIREGVSVAEAQMKQTALIDYAPRSNPNIDYVKFTKEVIQKIQKMEEK